MSRSVTVRLPDSLYATLTADGTPISAAIIERLKYEDARGFLAWACDFEPTPEEAKLIRQIVYAERVRFFKDAARTRVRFKRYTDIVRFNAKLMADAADEMDRRAKVEPAK